MNSISKNSDQRFNYTKKSVMAGASLGAVCAGISLVDAINLNPKIKKSSFADKRAYIKGFYENVSSLDQQNIESTISKSIKASQKYLKKDAIVKFIAVLGAVSCMGVAADVIKNKIHKLNAKVNKPQVNIPQVKNK